MCIYINAATRIKMHQSGPVVWHDKRQQQEIFPNIKYVNVVLVRVGWIGVLPGKMFRISRYFRQCVNYYFSMLR